MATMTKYRCILCGWIYDPEKGEPDFGMMPGTSFEQLPYQFYVCPVCGASKGQFEKVTD
jgi:rubredoxin